MLERAGNQFPDKMFIISEFGTPGIFAANTVEADKLRVHTLNYQLDVFRKYDWIAGAIFWCYQDYKSHRNLWPGFKQGYVDHGVVDEYRQRRPSFFEWQKRTEPVSLSAKWKYTDWYRTSGFEVTISRKPLTELPSYPLKNYKLNWEFRDGEGKLLQNGSFALADLDTEQKLTGDWPSEPNLHHAVLRLSLLNPRGETEAQKSLAYLFPLADGQEIDQMTTPNVRP